jgi:Phosphotransferase system, mannose/fructose/N-acetylgalactosamine-specific component IIB
MANIALTRIDSRLIHGQVITKWKKITNAGQMIIIDNLLAKDPFMSKIYLMSAPPDCKVRILTVDEAIAAWEKDQLGPANATTIILFKDVKTALESHQKGLAMKKLQVGGLPGEPGRKVVYKNISMNAQDATDLRAIQTGGTEVFFQTVPEDSPASLESVAKIFE